MQLHKSTGNPGAFLFSEQRPAFAPIKYAQTALKLIAKALCM
jgi:hypothetical protein